MIRATLTSLLSRKVRLLLSGLAVVLGVMFVSGSFILTDALGRTFDQFFAGVYANTDVEVRRAPNTASAEFDSGERVTAPIGEAELRRIAAVPGVASAEGVVMADGARLIGTNGKVVPSTGPPRFGVDWPSHASDVQLREGRGPAADDEIAINAALAEAAGVTVGDRVGVLTLEPKRTFTIVGIFGYPGGTDSMGGSQTVAFTRPVAQRLMLGAPGSYAYVDVKAATGVSDEELRDRLAAELGPGFDVKTGEQLAEAASGEFAEALNFVNYLLLGFAAVALFVAVFLILNTFSILVAQRTRELALLRAVGAGRRQVIGSVLLEAIVIGLIAAVLGLAAGLGVGALLANVFGRFAGDLRVAAIGLPAGAVVGAFAVGVGVTVIAALVPAVRASRIPPVAALRDAAIPDRPLTKLTLAGAAVLATGAGLLAVGLTGSAGDQTLWTILGGVLLSFIGTALLTPLVARPVSGLIGRLFAWSVPGRLGQLNAGRNPRRTAITAAALMVGIALITGVNTVITSGKESFRKVVADQARVDLVIAGENDGFSMATYDPAVIDEVSKLAGVQAATAQYGDVAVVNGERDYVVAYSDVAALTPMFGLTATDGAIDRLSPEEVLVDATTATERGLAVGSPVTVQPPRGEPLTLTVAGIYGGSDLLAGVIVPVDHVDQFYVSQPSAGYIQLAPGASVDAVRSEVDRLLADSPEVSVVDRTQYLNDQLAAADQLLLIVQILLALAILIAVLGVVNTLALSVLERTRELGLLRAVGLRRGQMMRMVTVEAMVISLFGAVLGLLVGAGLGTAVVRALADEGITELALPWTQMGTYLLLAALVGVAAAVLPAIRAARVNVLNAIAYE
ncbi:MAG TPA: FtsX-like permease family protein [Micromonosporaceae bacterium]|nr:FtsX-like permease family protein [Micromonosporaceae bacterium]